MSSDSDMGATVARVLGEIAPEVDLSTVPGDANIRDRLDLDSFDYLTFIRRLYEATGIDVPESDYRSLETLDGCVAYLTRRKQPP